MKKFLYILALSFSIIVSVQAQPQAINNQCIGRDSVGHPLLNQNISLQLRILNCIATGLAVSIETQNLISRQINFWEEMDFCNQLAEGGFYDWRVPTYEEVEKYVQLNELPPSTFIVITQTVSPGSVNSHSLIILRDYSNSSGYGCINCTDPVNTATVIPHVNVLDNSSYAKKIYFSIFTGHRLPETLLTI
jgi:hypothetical protein